ncbi:hypothetical protein [Nitratifractor sp.]|uniref:hypothetical protein n=1 Tax=Nitratifractor sp. TaxID=2268144 RepID=UPI0025FB1652|nr:hypothetical protein [Nitratifractor sp.]
MSQKIFLPVTLLALLGTCTTLQAGKIFKRYPVKSGMIFYDINISGKSANGFSTHTSGIARLVFDQWGARELKEEDATETQRGDFNETRDIHSLTKMDHGTIYTVDYDDQTIYKTRDRSLDLSIAQGEDLSHENIQLIKEMKGHKIGSGNVAGFPCELWKAKDQKICFYQGIPLSITIDAPGFHSERKAVQVVLNHPIPDEQFKLPDFPVTVDEEYTSNPAAETRTEDYIASIKDLQAKMKSLGINPDEEDQNLSPEQEKKVINILGERYLKKQKRLLPKLLVALQGAKECVAKAANGNEAKKCIEPVNKIDEELGDRTENFDYAHFKEKRDAILDSLEKEINYLKVTNECVQQHDKTTDVILCTEGNLGEEEQ